MENYKIVSLGYNCYVKKYVDDNFGKMETNFFDNTGISMWAINELFKNDFSDLFNIEDYEKMEIVPKYFVYTNKKYYLRFLHDLSDLSRFNTFKESYQRRIKRLDDLIKNQNILFIRFEEPQTNRIMYDFYKEKFKKSELDYIKDFSNIIKKKYPNAKFKIIYISDIYEIELFEDSNLLILNKNAKYNWTWSNCSAVIKDMFEKNNQIIKQFLNK